MPGYAICPYCKATVQPVAGPGGEKTCPRCRNTGSPMPAPASAYQPPFQPVPAAPAPPSEKTSGRAIASLCLGIGSIVLAVLGAILGPIAIVFGVKALKETKSGQVGGQGLAIGGIVTGILGILIGLTVVLAAIVFVLVSNLASAPQAIEFAANEGGDFLLVTSADDGLSWSDFSVSGTAGCDLPFGPVQEGDVVECDRDGTVTIRDEDGGVVYEGEV